MNKLYFVTGSIHKFQEVQMMIPDIQQLDIDLPEIQEINPKTIIKAKLEAALLHKKGRFIVEDTSLYLDSLGGLPGPLIKRFMKTIGNQGLYEIAHKMNNYKAEAKTIVGYAKSSEEIYFFEGDIKGTIVPPNGASSFGRDPLFQPAGQSMAFSEMSREEKNKISMRAMAIKKLKEFLENDN